jgi:amino acid permease
MALSGTELFTREETLAGFPARRAQAALFLIESRTAHWVAQARQVLDPFLTEATTAERDLAFVEAFARGKAPPLRPTIQDLEHYAPAWRNLAPDNARGRAALAHLLGQKYHFTAAAVPGIRAALGLDEPAIEAAYEKLYSQPLGTIYAPRPAPAERLRWASARVALWFDRLPPFWTVFILTFTQTVGATILALPIALAGVGPIPGIVLLCIFGLVNIFTIAAQAEAVARSGEMRYGIGFLGRMVETYLGPTGAGVAAVAIAADCIVTLLAFYAGFGNSLADATHLPPGMWAAGLFLVILYFLRRESLSATITSSLVIGVVNFSILAVIIVLAFAHARPENLSYMNVPLVAGGAADVGILQVIFGVVLGAYFGHLSVSNCARLVLQRDPSARSLTWGAAAALAAAIVLYSVWVLAVNGAVPPEVMASETGTALGPLAVALGPVVNVLGAIYVILAMAIVSVHFSLSLYNLVRERLPRHAEPVIWLPRRHGRLVLAPRPNRAGQTLSLTYMGLASGERDLRPRFKVESQQGEMVQRVEIADGRCWDETKLRSLWPQLDPRMQVAVTVQAATADGARLQISTPLSVRYEGEWDTSGLHVTDLLDLPADTRRLLTWLMRRGDATATEVAAYTSQDMAAVRLALAELVEQGLLVARPATAGRVGREGETRYRPQFAFRRGGSLGDDLWRALDGEVPATPAPSAGRGSRRERDSAIAVSRPPRLARLGPAARFWLAASPIAIIFLVTEVLLWTGHASFVGILGFLGTVVDSCLAGLFPVLLLYASRRKGEFVPGKVYRMLGQPWLLGTIYVLFIAGILLHGLVIWQDPIQRLCAVSVSLIMLVVTGILIRKGAFSPRVVVEVCEDLTPVAPGLRRGEGRGRFTITACGKPAAARVRSLYAGSEGECTATAGDLPHFGDLRQITLDLPATAARDLKLWAHRLTPEGVSELMPVVVEVRGAGTVRTADLQVTGGQALFPWSATGCQITLCFDRAEKTDASP